MCSRIFLDGTALAGAAELLQYLRQLLLRKNNMRNDTMILSLILKQAECLKEKKRWYGAVAIAVISMKEQRRQMLARHVPILKRTLSFWVKITNKNKSID